jgi:hypothetical protein
MLFQSFGFLTVFLVFRKLTAPDAENKLVSGFLFTILVLTGTVVMVTGWVKTKQGSVLEKNPSHEKDRIVSGEG